MFLKINEKTSEEGKSYSEEIINILQTNFLPLSDVEKERENLFVFFVSYNKVVACDLTQGTFNFCPVFNREIAKVAIIKNCEIVILFHNHPSGVCKASPEDKIVLAKLQEQLGLFSISVFSYIFDNICQNIEEVVLDEEEKK